MSDILLNDPSGNPVLVSADSAAKALASGYSPATTQQQSEHANELANQEKYGEGVGNEVKAAGLGALQGLTFGAGNYALSKSGLVSPETQAELEKRNPISHGLGVLGGAIAPAVLSAGATAEATGAKALLGYAPTNLAARAGSAVAEGAAGLLPEAASGIGKVLQGAATGALGSSVEASFYGAGNVVNDMALGDPNVNAEKLVAETSNAALNPLNLGVGALFGGIHGLSSGKGAVENAVEATGAEAAATGTPKGLADIEARVAGGEAAGFTPGELPSKQILQDADKTIADSQFPVHEAQLKALDDANAHEIYKAVKESNTPEGKILRDYESLQKTEGVRQLNETVGTLSPGKELVGDAYKGGEETIEAIRNDYKTRRVQDAEAFDVLKKEAPNVSTTQADVLTSLGKALPGADLAQVMKIGEDGLLTMEKYNADMPISKETYAAIKDITKAGKNGEMTLQQLRNLRDTISDRINPITGAMRTNAELGAIKREFMDLMQGTIETKAPGMELRPMFKRYAQNEQARELMEKVLGGKLDENANILRQMKPENVGDRIFRDSATLQAAKETLAPEVFNRMAGNYLKEQVAKFTDQGTFSSQKFASWVKNNKTTLEMALPKEMLDRVNALADKMRILPDAVKLNPSGTAKAIGLFDAVNKMSVVAQNAGHLIEAPHKVIGGFFKHLGEGMQAKAQVAELEKILAESGDAPTRMSRLASVERTLNATTNKITSLSSKIFSTALDAAPAVPGGLIMMSYPEKREKYDKIKKRLDQLSSPDEQLNHVEKSTKDLYPVAPNISGALQRVEMQKISFLQGKAPGNTKLAPLSAPIQPSNSELSKFFRYLDIANNPMLTLKQVATGTLVPESIETMTALYPGMLSEMRQQVMTKLASVDGEKLPYKKKLMLSGFLGMDLIAGLSQQAIMANQVSLHSPSLKQDNIEMAQQMGKPSQKGMESVTLADRSQTGIRATETRKMRS